MQEQEIWKEIPGYEGLYQVSNLGKVKSVLRQSWNGKVFIIQREKILKGFYNKKYYYVPLSKDGKKKNFQVHQLIAMAFLNHKPDRFKTIVDHIDENPSNNILKNLQLITNRENISKGFLKKNTSSKYTGVHYNKREKKFRTCIGYNGIDIYLGYFKNELQAKDFYLLALNNLDKFENPKQFREYLKNITNQSN